MKYLSNPDMLLGLMRQMLSGMEVTLPLFFYTLIFSLPLGVIVALMRMCKLKIVSVPTRVCILVLRGTPLILQIFAIYFILPRLLGHPFDRMASAVVAFVINYAAYFAEIYRSGIQSMPVGQYEAAEVLGYTKAQTFVHIILPQVFKRVMPSITNEVVTLVKDTSMAFTVSYQEMFTIGKQISNSEASFVPFLVAGVFYFVFNAVVDFVMGRIEKRMSYYK